ncbi:hypothetical protein D3C76_785840 [compost metagenome]
MCPSITGAVPSSLIVSLNVFSVLLPDSSVTDAVTTYSPTVSYLTLLSSIVTLEVIFPSISSIATIDKALSKSTVLPFSIAASLPVNSGAPLSFTGSNDTDL